MSNIKLLNAIRAIKAASEAHGTALQTLKVRCEGKTREEAKKLLLPLFAEVYDCRLKSSDSRQNSGVVVLDASSKSHGSCKRYLNLTLAAIFKGKASATKWSFSHEQMEAARGFAAVKARFAAQEARFAKLFISKTAAMAALKKVK